MKRTFLIISLIMFLNCRSQNDAYYILKNERFCINVEKDGTVNKNAFLQLNHGDDFDRYFFSFNLSGADLYGSEQKLDFKKPKILSDSYNLTATACESHEFFSKQVMFWLVYAKDDGYYGWPIYYAGTTRNMITSSLH